MENSNVAVDFVFLHGDTKFFELYVQILLKVHKPGNSKSAITSPKIGQFL